ncbi:NUDIX hydrolase [soil metagenome]
MTAEDRPESWPVHEVEQIWKGSAPFSVRRDVTAAPYHPDYGFRRLVLEHPGAAVILSGDEQEWVLVLHQYRHPASMRFVELPAGLLDVEGEDAVEAAKRELREEGLVLAEEWTHLFTTYSSPGLSSESIAYFLARGRSAAPDRGDFEPAHEDADMTLAWEPVDDLLEGVRAGRSTDGPTAQALLAYALWHR